MGHWTDTEHLLEYMNNCKTNLLIDSTSEQFDFPHEILQNRVFFQTLALKSIFL